MHGRIGSDGAGCAEIPDRQHIGIADRSVISETQRLSERAVLVIESQDTLERKMRFFTSRLLNFSGVKITSELPVSPMWPHLLATAMPHRQQKSRHEGARWAGVPVSMHEHHLGVRRLHSGGCEL
jgi:hypothetical protein